MSRNHSSRPPRVSTEIPAVLIDTDGVEFPVIVVDLSSAGFRLRTKERLVAGEPVRLSVRAGDHYPAEIQWASASEAGGRFLEPVRLIDGIPT
jgi:hypothetical protein